MAELKTKVTTASVEGFINAVKDENRRNDALTLLTMLKKITKEEPRLWGNGTIGFGLFNYKSARSAQQGEWYLAGFSPRASNLTVYVMPGFSKYKSFLDKLGKHKTGGGCLYLNKLSDIDLKVLSALIETGFHDIKKMIIENKSVFGQTSLGPKSNAVKKEKTTVSKKTAAKQTNLKKKTAVKINSKVKTKNSSAARRGTSKKKK